MLLTPDQTLSERLVLALGRKQQCPAAWLLKQVSTKENCFSIQAVYKELRKLQQQGIVFKCGANYGLSLSWILNLWETVESMLDVQNSEQGQSMLLPAAGEKKTFHFSRLAAVDDFWIHSLFILLQNSSERTLYQWLPHPWFHLIHSRKSGPLQQALKTSKYKVQSIIGGNTYLDRLSERITTKGSYEFYYAAGPFQEERSIYYSASKEFLLSIRLDRRTSEAIEKLYQSVKRESELDLIKAARTIHTAGSITLSIERETRKASKVWKEFREYFSG